MLDGLNEIPLPRCVNSKMLKMVVSVYSGAIAPISNFCFRWLPGHI